MSKNSYFYIFQPRPMGPGPTSPSDFFLEMANFPVSSLILPLNYIKISFHFWYQVKSSSHFVTNSIWNFEVSHIFSFSRWHLLVDCTIPWNLSHISFSDFLGRECDVFLRLWCHYKGIPSKIGDSPRFHSDFVSERAFRHPNRK